MNNKNKKFLKLNTYTRKFTEIDYETFKTRPNALYLMMYGKNFTHRFGKCQTDIPRRGVNHD